MPEHGWLIRPRLHAHSSAMLGAGCCGWGAAAAPLRHAGTWTARRRHNASTASSQHRPHVQAPPLPPRAETL